LERELGELDRVASQLFDLLRCSSSMPRLTPPGRPQLGCTARPPIILIKAWPSRRILSTLPAISMPTLLITPRIFRSAWARSGPPRIRAAQGIEVGRVVGGEEDIVKQLPQLLGRGRRIDVKHAVQGLGGGHVVRFRAHPADAGRQVGHVFDHPPLANFSNPRSSGICK